MHLWLEYCFLIKLTVENLIDSLGLQCLVNAKNIHSISYLLALELKATVSGDFASFHLCKVLFDVFLNIISIQQPRTHKMPVYQELLVFSTHSRFYVTKWMQFMKYLWEEMPVFRKG